MCDLIVAAFRSHGTLLPCGSEKCGRLVLTPYWRLRILPHTKVKPQLKNPARIVLTIINCLQLPHDYIQLSDYIRNHGNYLAAVLGGRLENMGKAKLNTLSSRGNYQVLWNAPFSKPIGLTSGELSGQGFHSPVLY